MHLFAVLGEPVRFRIVELLASGSHRAGELSSVVISEFGISRAAVSHHLRILRDEGVVVVQADEAVRLYRLRWNFLDRVDRVLLDLYEKWDQRDGWPYVADPLRIPPRRHRLTERARRPVDSWKVQVEPLAPDDEWEEEDDDVSGTH
jgi:DNA-binding transcriptional ArsR family regulator